MASIILINVKQEAYGSHCSDEKQFFAINKLTQSYHYTYTVVKKIKGNHLDSIFNYSIDYTSSLKECHLVWTNLGLVEEYQTRTWDNICSLLCYYVSSVGKVCGPSFKKTAKVAKWFPKMLCFKFGENWPNGSWEEDENMKKVDENDKDNNDGRRSNVQLSLAQVS